MKLRDYLFGLLILIGSGSVTAQPIDSSQFEVEYNKLLKVFAHARDSVESLLFLIDQEYELDEIKKARLNLIRIENYDLYNTDKLNYAFAESEVLSSQNLPKLEKARRYLEQGRATLAIPLILQYLETVEADSDSADFARITLVEGYRLVKEFQKGIAITNKILSKKGLAPSNRAYAYNRLAALYAECNSSLIKLRGDSVLKYSKLCINLSKDSGYIFQLATAQNELAYYYNAKKNYNLALNYAKKAHKNFSDAGKQPQALRTVCNIAKIYYDMGGYRDALEILNNTINQADINENRSAFLTFYLLLASIHQKTRNTSDAYEYLKLARDLQEFLFKKKINAQIYDLAAQYETEKKEAENKELRMANEIKALKLADKNETIRFLVIVIVLIGISLVLILFLFFQKRKTNIKLVKANLDIVKAEKVGRSGILDDIEKVELSKPLDENSELLEKLEIYMENEKPYLDSNITLDDICHKLQTNRTYLSKLINEHFHKNFNEYINEFRTKTARQILADTTKYHISIEGVGQMSGFNSRSTFFTCFKKQTGLSPSYFRESISDV